MKFLVNEMEKEVFDRIKGMFLEEDEVVFIEYDYNYENATETCENPFYVEENIKDIKALINLLEDTDYSRTDLIEREDWDWDDYYPFRDFVYGVLKQRELGKKVTDLEYVYETLKDEFDVYIDYAFDDEDVFEENYPVLYGKSRLGEMNLYKDGDLFVFDVLYEDETPIFKLPTEECLSWHPYDFFAAISDAERFMRGDESLLKEHENVDE